MQRLIFPWEYRHLHAFGLTRISGGVMAATAGVVATLVTSWERSTYRWTMRYPSVLPGVVLCTVVLAACGRPATSPGESLNGCVRSPTTFLSGTAPESGATLTVKVGAVVYVALVEAEKYLSWPAGTKPPPRVFPWAAARSSDPSVLRRVALCPSSGAYTLPVVVYAFRALTPGTTTLTAPITQAWKRVKPARRRGLHPYHATVTVAS